MSPRVAELYAGLSEKTVARDLAALEAAQLIEREDELIAPNFGLMLVFLPLRATSGTVVTDPEA